MGASPSGATAQLFRSVGTDNERNSNATPRHGTPRNGAPAHRRRHRKQASVRRRARGSQSLFDPIGLLRRCPVAHCSRCLLGMASSDVWRAEVRAWLLKWVRNGTTTVVAFQTLCGQTHTQTTHSTVGQGRADRLLGSDRSDHCAARCTGHGRRHLPVAIRHTLSQQRASHQSMTRRLSRHLPTRGSLSPLRCAARLCAVHSAGPCRRVDQPHSCGHHSRSER